MIRALTFGRLVAFLLTGCGRRSKETVKPAEEYVAVPNPAGFERSIG